MWWISFFSKLLFFFIAGHTGHTKMAWWQSRPARKIFSPVPSRVFSETVPSCPVPLYFLIFASRPVPGRDGAGAGQIPRPADLWSRWRERTNCPDNYVVEPIILLRSPLFCSSLGNDETISLLIRIACNQWRDFYPQSLTPTLLISMNHGEWSMNEIQNTTKRRVFSEKQEKEESFWRNGGTRASCQEDQSQPSSSLARSDDRL